MPKRCERVGCEKWAQQGGVCVAHGAKLKRCRIEGCDRHIVQGGLCIAHGAKKKRCSVESCVKHVFRRGVCRSHLVGLLRCQFTGCSKYAMKGQNTCSTHTFSRRCGVEGCRKYAKCGGICSTHNPQIHRCSASDCKKWAKIDGRCLAHRLDGNQDEIALYGGEHYGVHFHRLHQRQSAPRSSSSSQMHYRTSGESSIIGYNENTQTYSSYDDDGESSQYRQHSSHHHRDSYDSRGSFNSYYSSASSEVSIISGGGVASITEDEEELEARRHLYTRRAESLPSNLHLGHPESKQDPVEMLSAGTREMMRETSSLPSMHSSSNSSFYPSTASRSSATTNSLGEYSHSSEQQSRSQHDERGRASGGRLQGSNSSSQALLPPTSVARERAFQPKSPLSVTNVPRSEEKIVADNDFHTQQQRGLAQHHQRRHSSENAHHSHRGERLLSVMGEEKASHSYHRYLTSENPAASSLLEQQGKAWYEKVQEDNRRTAEYENSSRRQIVGEHNRRSSSARHYYERDNSPTTCGIAASSTRAMIASSAPNHISSASVNNATIATPLSKPSFKNSTTNAGGWCQ